MARPVFYQGEQVGERRHYDERLTMFLLRYRDPVRYGAWLDGMEARRHPDGAGIVLAHALNAVLDAAHAQPDDAGADGDEPSDEDQPWDPDADRPLAEGPPPPDRRPLPDYDGPEHLRELAEMCHAAGQQDDFAFHDPAADDWRSALLVCRSRRDSSADGA